MNTKMSSKIRLMVSITPFDSNKISLAPFDSGIIKGDLSKIIITYINLCESLYPGITSNMNDGVHNINDCIKYVNNQVYNKAVIEESVSGLDDVFRWSINYFLSPIIDSNGNVVELEVMNPSGISKITKSEKDIEIERNGLLLFDDF